MVEDILSQTDPVSEKPGYLAPPVASASQIGVHERAQAARFSPWLISAIVLLVAAVGVLAFGIWFIVRLRFQALPAQTLPPAAEATFETAPAAPEVFESALPVLPKSDVGGPASPLPLAPTPEAPRAAQTPAPSSDTDRDGLSDEQERSRGTDPTLPDTDGDGLSDYDEVNVFGTDPNKSDTDADGYSDYDELRNGYDPKGQGKLLDLEGALRRTPSGDN